MLAGVTRSKQRCQRRSQRFRRDESPERRMMRQVPRKGAKEEE